MEALYNKYRPQIFEDVVGQEHIERTLKNAIASDKISHAYLFTGPRGTGKTTTARLLAKALLCQNGPTPDPDGECEDCKLIANGEHPDVYELDAASRTGVESVREEIIGKVNYAPTRGRYKVYIIDEVHMLSNAAFNALLKTLEEPPAHVVFILCTTDPQKVLETIHSRCQRFDFRRISADELVVRLGAICELEGVSYEGDALDLIAHHAQGGMRDALTSLEQLIAFGEGDVTTELAERLLGSIDSSELAEIVRAIGERDAASCFRWTSEYMDTGADLAQFAQDLAQHMRNMYVMSLAGCDVALEITETTRREMESELQWFGPDRLSRLLTVLSDLISELKTSTNQRLTFEIALTRMLRAESDLTLEALAERIESLERKVAAGLPMPSQAVQQAQTAHAELATRSEQVNRDVAQGSARMKSDQAVSQDHQSEASKQHADGSFNGKDATQLWASVMAHLKKVGPAYGVIFMNTVPSFENGKLVISFSPDNGFAFKASKKQDASEALRKALERAGAGGIAYEIVQRDSAGATATALIPREIEAQPQRQAELQQEPVRQPEPQPQWQEPVRQPEPEPQRQDPERKPQPQQPAEPDYDMVPLDVYDDMAPVETVLEQEVQSIPQAEPQQGDGSPVGLEDLLSTAFGEGFTIQEVSGDE